MTDFQLKEILFFYIISLDFNTLGPAFLQCRYSFLKVRVWKTVKIFIYGTLNFLIGGEASSGLRRDRSLRVPNQENRGGIAKQILLQMLQFCHCQRTFVSRCIVLVKDDFFLFKPGLFPQILTSS